MTIPAPDDSAAQELPADALASTRPAGRSTRRRPRRGDLVATAVFAALLVALVVLYVITAVDRSHNPGYSVAGTGFANGLAIIAPVVIGVFAIVFSAILIRRRVVAFWLPIVAGILIVALYSVTGDMLDTAVLDSVIG